MHIIEADPRQTFLDNSSEWRRNLSVEQYVERELKLEQVYPKRYWAVVVDGEYAAHCRAIVRPATSGTEACIGNVYTLPKFRKRGYAAALLEHVTATLTKECELVTLFSDIGDYYSRFGYKMYPDVRTLTLPVEKVQWPAAAAKLSKTSLTTIAGLHRKLLGSVGPSEIALLPSEQYNRECITEYELTAASLGQAPLDLFGAQHGDEFVSWTYNVPQDKLQVYVMSSWSPELLQAAHHAAGLANLSKVEIWASSVFGEIPGGTDRSGSLPMYISSKTWVHAGKYSWF